MSDMDSLATAIAAMEAAEREMVDGHHPWVRWGGGKQADGSLQFPYAIYDKQLDDVWRAFGAFGYSRDAALDYIAWRDRFGKIDGDSIARMTSGDLTCAVVGFVRTERFVEGSLACALCDGLLLALARRMVEVGPGVHVSRVTAAESEGDQQGLLKL